MIFRAPYDLRKWDSGGGWGGGADYGSTVEKWNIIVPCDRSGVYGFPKLSFEFPKL